MLTRRRGFTLIELLVVIAIIAILAAMLFPVFARARESARKIQCLSNVKNVAMAVQMYLTDYDRTPPREHRQEAYDYFYNRPGHGSGTRENCNHTTHANPYLRWPVIFDEYIKNRDIWRCPSAKKINHVEWIVPYADWLGYLKATEGKWGQVNDTLCSGGPCCEAFPPGWGGSVTDSILQGVKADEGTTEITIVPVVNYEVKTGQVVCADSSNMEIWMASLVAFPDACRTGCGPAEPAAGCCSADWVNCSDTKACGPDWTMKKKFFDNAEWGKPFTRHLGGSNIGFMDGHAAWMAAGAIVANSPTYEDHNAGRLRGIGCIIRECPSS